MTRETSFRNARRLTCPTGQLDSPVSSPAPQHRLRNAGLFSHLYALLVVALPLLHDGETVYFARRVNPKEGAMNLPAVFRDMVRDPRFWPRYFFGDWYSSGVD